jgi:hypothetical protein
VQDLYTWRRAVPALGHTTFRQHHDDGHLNETFNGPRWHITPTETTGSDRGGVWVQAFRYSAIETDWTSWRSNAPQIELSVEGSDGMATSTLLPAEARQVAAEVAQRSRHGRGRYPVTTHPDRTPSMSSVDSMSSSEILGREGSTDASISPLYFGLSESVVGGAR